MEKDPIFRLAALSDIHLNLRNYEEYLKLFDQLSQEHDAILVAGDLTDIGSSTQFNLAREVFSAASIPVIAVLGNHDIFQHHIAAITHQLSEASGAAVLQGNRAIIQKANRELLIAGIIGHSGGFDNSREDYATQTNQDRSELSRQLAELDHVLSKNPEHEIVVLMHYAPIKDTIIREPLHLYPMLGSFQFAKLIDKYVGHVKHIIHGHVHHGSPHGLTKLGIPVSNVTVPVLLEAYSQPYRTIEI